MRMDLIGMECRNVAGSLTRWPTSSLPRLAHRPDRLRRQTAQIFAPHVIALLVDIFPSIGTIEPAPASRRKDIRRHQSRVNPHTIRRPSRRPVRHAAAVPTTVELNGFVAPQIAFRRTLHCNNAHVCRRVVGPQDTITPTDGAIAFCDVYRRGTNLQFHRAAMARGFDHDSPRYYLHWFQSIAKLNEIWQRPRWRSQFSWPPQRKCRSSFAPYTHYCDLSLTYDSAQLPNCVAKSAHDHLQYKARIGAWRIRHECVMDGFCARRSWRRRRQRAGGRRRDAGSIRDPAAVRSSHHRHRRRDQRSRVSESGRDRFCGERVCCRRAICISSACITMTRPSHTAKRCPGTRASGFRAHGDSVRDSESRS
jgi:hypothetical protein